jgi:hypothetical protein
VIDRISAFIFYLYEVLICSLRNTADKQLTLLRLRTTVFFITEALVCYGCRAIYGVICLYLCASLASTGGAGRSLARPGRKQATATEDVDVHVSYL